MGDYHKTLFESDKQRLKEVESFITANLNTELNINLLCDQFGYSDATFRRHFNLFFKKSFSRYLLDMRMDKAAHLLAEKGTAISIIANMVGYKKHSSFTHAFSRHFGCPPKHSLS